jgi:hypothetical protein
MEHSPSVNPRIPAWLRIALPGAIGVGVMTGILLIRDTGMADAHGALAVMLVTGAMVVAFSATLAMLVLAALIARAFGWRPGGADDPGQDGGGGGGGGGGPDLPPDSPPGLDLDDFDRLRGEWERSPARSGT